MSNACETKQKEEKTHRVNAAFVPNQEIVERRARPRRTLGGCVQLVAYPLAVP